MTLLEYLAKEGLTLDQFGARIGRTAATVSRIARGVHKPDWETMEAIRKATRGKVMPNSFADAENGKSAAEPARQAG